MNFQRTQLQTQSTPEVAEYGLGRMPGQEYRSRAIRTSIEAILDFSTGGLLSAFQEMEGAGSGSTKLNPMAPESSR